MDPPTLCVIISTSGGGGGITFDIGTGDDD
jgi:hypothetical protein